MKKTDWLSIALLFFLATSGLYGGGSLMVDPTGGLIHLPFQLIEKSFFVDYFLPGLILFVFIGLFATVAIGLTISQSPSYPSALILQSGIVIIWLVCQIILLQVFFWLQLVVAITGISLLILGFQGTAGKTK